MGQITAPELLACIRRIEARGSIETAHRALRDCGQIFAYSIATGGAERNAATDIRGALQPAVKSHHAAITDPKAVGALLRAIDGYQGDLPTRCALKLATLLFVRPGELRAAEWTEFDLDRVEWNITASRMKTREPHLVPLSVHHRHPLRAAPADGSRKLPLPVSAEPGSADERKLDQRRPTTARVRQDDFPGGPYTIAIT